MSPALPTFGNATLTTTDTRATFALPDWSIESYRTFVSIKAALPRVEVDAKARTLTCHVADLARLGVDVRALAGGLVLDEAPRASSPAHRGLDRYGHILTWRDATGFSGPWVVLDDENYGYPRDRFVLTDPATGLTPEAVERAVSILRTPVSP